jgi:hypothetical protein
MPNQPPKTEACLTAGELVNIQLGKIPKLQSMKMNYQNHPRTNRDEFISFFANLCGFA